MPINVIHNVISNFHNTEGNLMDMQYAMWTFFYICIFFFKFSINDSISEFNEKSISFIYIRILILQNFSLFSICEFFNTIDHTRI